MSMKVVKRDISLRELIEFDKALSKKYITYGVHKDKGVEMRGKVNEAEIASFIEFGTRLIPARPAIRTYLVSPKKRRELLNKEAEIMGYSIKRKSAKLFWNNLAKFVQKHIKGRILSGLKPSNAPSTIAHKGFDLPWVDTGKLVFEDMEARVNEHK